MANRDVLAMVFAILFFLGWDAMYLGLWGKRIWRETILGVENRIPGEKIDFNYGYAALAYVFLFFGLAFFVQSKSNGDATEAAINGFAFGASVYGVYNFTNAAIFKKYPLRTALVDMSAGITACGLSMGLGNLVANQIKL